MRLDQSGEEWLATLIRSLQQEQRSPFGEPLPAFPPEDLQRNTTGLSAESALRQAHSFYEDVQDALAKAGTPLQPYSRVLDFGFGWGRISRVFMRDVPIANIHGIDVDPNFVAITRSLYGSDNFEVCDAFPPSRFVPETFDLVYSYSVFSHLSELACRAWMNEFHRILKPGGIAAFTTRHETFFDFCEWAASQPEASPYIRALGDLFPDLDAARQHYRAGNIVHATSAGVGGGGPRDSSFYGETWIPESYAAHSFGDGWEFVSGYFDGQRYDQACFALRRL